jgi:hypothetical protein
MKRKFVNPVLAFGIIRPVSRLIFPVIGYRKAEIRNILFNRVQYLCINIEYYKKPDITVPIIN